MKNIIFGQHNILKIYNLDLRSDYIQKNRLVLRTNHTAELNSL